MSIDLDRGLVLLDDQVYLIVNVEKTELSRILTLDNGYTIEIEEIE